MPRNQVVIILTEEEGIRLRTILMEGIIPKGKIGDTALINNIINQISE